jgi:predicted ATPase
MLTRFQVAGFKNLVDVDIRFGPFTCIAGANGTGKSNLFDAIHFLSSLADKPLLEAAMGVRDDQAHTGSIRNLFHRAGDKYDETMRFDVEMLIPQKGEDELGQQAVAKATFLRYVLELKYREHQNGLGPGGLEIVREDLTHFRKGNAHKHLRFPHEAKTWRNSVVHAGIRSVPFISTDQKGGSGRIKLHQDGHGGRPQLRAASSLPRTILSVVNAAEAPTATLARTEMLSWRLLQLEPSALRRPDSFIAPTTLGSDGSHLAATLYHLAGPDSDSESASKAYAQIARRLAELVEDVRDVHVDRDEKRQLLTLYVTNRDGTSHPAVSLSDGTLRFLALAVLEKDPHATGLICLEEPENGIHPGRIGAMLELLHDIASDSREPVDSDNPLRQVVINTHSPLVVAQIDHEDLVVAEEREMICEGRNFARACFHGLSGTWRTRLQDGQKGIALGQLLAYLDPLGKALILEKPGAKGSTHRKRVMDREDLLPWLPGLTREQ